MDSDFISDGQRVTSSQLSSGERLVNNNLKCSDKNRCPPPALSQLYHLP